MKLILRYFKGTLELGLSISSHSSFILHTYTDANWVGCFDDCRSTSDFVSSLDLIIFYGIQRNKIPFPAQVPIEVEYRAMTDAYAELIWLQQFLRELYVPLISKPILWCDNLDATFFASNFIFHARTKHIEIDYQFVRKRVVSRHLEVGLYHPKISWPIFSLNLCQLHALDFSEPSWPSLFQVAQLGGLTKGHWCKYTEGIVVI